MFLSRQRMSFLGPPANELSEVSPCHSLTWKKRKNASWGGATGFFAPAQFYPSLNGRTNLDSSAKTAISRLPAALPGRDRAPTAEDKQSDGHSLNYEGRGGGPVTIQGPFKSCAGCLVSSSQIYQEGFFSPPPQTPRPPSCTLLPAEMLIVTARPTCLWQSAGMSLNEAPPPATRINVNIITEVSLLCPPPTFDLRWVCGCVCVCVSSCGQSKSLIINVRVISCVLENSACISKDQEGSSKTVRTRLSVDANVMQHCALGRILWNFRLRRKCDE